MSMSKGIAIFIYTCSGMMAAISQLLLKVAAQQNEESKGLQKILNTKVIFSYLILFVTIFMNMIAMRYISYKYTPILATISYVFVLLFSRVGLKESISKKQMVGMILIFTGIIVFNSN